jgi:hypothetical protein
VTNIAKLLELLRKVDDTCAAAGSAYLRLNRASVSFHDFIRSVLWPTICRVPHRYF